MAIDGQSLSSVPSNFESSVATSLMQEFESWLRAWNAPGSLLASPPEALVKFRERARSEGLELHLNYPALHLSAAERLDALSHIVEELDDRGTTVFSDTRLSELSRNGNDWLLTLQSRADTANLMASRIILAPGRSGAAWVADLLENLGARIHQRLSLGIRLEVPSEIMAPLTDLTPDPRFSMDSPSGRFRTYACAKGAHITVVESAGVRRISLRPGGANPTANTSFSILWDPALALSQLSVIDPELSGWARYPADSRVAARARLLHPPASPGCLTVRSCRQSTGQDSKSSFHG